MTLAPSALTGWAGRYHGVMPLSFPFRIDPHTGAAATAPEASTAHISEVVALHVMVQPGELHLAPNFGTPSLPFSDALDAGALQLGLTDSGWGQVRVVGVNNRAIGDGAAESTITWEMS